jgi:2-desacetyl-2-hydroxyethyl bacteriochlorophyllide A dehydrogenase
VAPAPRANLEPGAVVVDVIAAGICGTDVRIFKGEHGAVRPPRVPGHEVVGRIAQAGGQLPDGLEIGTVVFVAPNIGCGRCTWCGRGQDHLCGHTEAIGITLDGGLADQVVVPARAVAHGNLIPVTGLDNDVAHLVLAEPLACVLRGQRRVNLQVGETVVVAGGGPVGLLHIALAKAQGAGVVVCSEPSPARREAALRAGASHAIDPGQHDLEQVVAELTQGRGADVVVTAAPVHGLQSQALRLAATWGRVLLFGGLPKSRPMVDLDTNLIHYKELTVTASTASNLDDCRQAAGLLAGGALDVAWMVTHRFGLDQAAQGLAAAQDPAVGKVAVVPQMKGSGT